MEKRYNLWSFYLVLVCLELAAYSLMGANEHIKTAVSPDDKYTIDFYRFDAGAAGSLGVRGELNGPLWFKKRIYLQHNVEQVEVEWGKNDKVPINNHTLKLGEGDTYGY